jgi:hypothetical protein
MNYDFASGLAIGLGWSLPILFYMARNRPTEHLNALKPFAEVYDKQMAEKKDTFVVYGQPLVGIGQISTANEFKEASRLYRAG